jgi:hypothetical protein
MKINGNHQNILVRAFEHFTNNSWLHFLFSLCIGIWAYIFFSIGGGAIGGIGFGVLCFVASYIGIAALPTSIYEVINRPWPLIVQLVILVVFLVCYKVL